MSLEIEATADNTQIEFHAARELEGHDISAHTTRAFQNFCGPTSPKSAMRISVKSAYSCARRQP
jgi:hypothetical protein